MFNSFVIKQLLIRANYLFLIEKFHTFLYGPFISDIVVGSRQAGQTCNASHKIWTVFLQATALKLFV